MKKIFLTILVFTNFISISQNGLTYIPPAWKLTGNALGTNTLFAGSIDNYSLRFRTNNIERLVIDTSTTANFKLNTNFFIDQTAGVNTINPKKLSFQPYAGDNTYPALYMAQNIPDAYNFTIIADSTLTKFNAPKQMILGQGGLNGIIMYLRQVEGVTGNDMASNGLYSFQSCLATTTAAVNNFIPHLKFSTLTYSMTGGTVASPFLINVPAPNIKSTSATNITQWTTLVINNSPTFDAGITPTRVFAITTTTDVSFSGRTILGLASTAPTATLDVRGNMIVSSNATITGIRCVGGLSVTTTFSAGTTSTLTGNTRIGSSTAPINALSVTGAIDCSTTFSAGTTSTLAGNTRIGSTTAPINALSVTGAIDCSTTFSAGTTATVTGALTAGGFSLSAGSFTVGSKSINTTAGNSATINSPVGRFRKSTSGTAFTLTNSFITANSIIILTLASGATHGYDMDVSAGAGTATINFNEPSLVSALATPTAPTTNQDVNFIIIN